MPKPGAPISHDAIKRSLKSKFKLILSENRILVDTITGYVKKAEKVYKEMEANDDVTPKQFAKAMEKLERAYSACVRLIMVASDLFEKGGDGEGIKNKDLIGASSCESETTVISSESSVTVTDTNRIRKAPNDKVVQRRSKSSEVRLHDGTRLRTKPQPASRKSRGVDITETSALEVANNESERLFVHPGGNPDFDHLIELQRFLHGLENEKQQTDHPSPCVTKEKKLATYKIQRETLAEFSKEDASTEASEEPVSHSLPKRLKVLKSAIENFRDRSSGDERIAQALSDIRELVLKNKESKESLGDKDLHPESDCKNGITSQVSPPSDSVSSENHHKTSKHCTNPVDEQGEDVKEPLGNELKPEPDDVQQGNKMREDSSTYVWAAQSASSDGKSQTVRNSEARVKAMLHLHQVQKPHPNQSRSRQQVQSCQQKHGCQHPTKTSPTQSPRAKDDNKDDINQIIVNRIVDMVSAKLVPRLQKSDGEEASAPTQQVTGRASESYGRDDPSRASEPGQSPPQLACSCFPHAMQQGNCCGNCGHVPKFRLYYNPGEHQPQLQKLQRRPHRPKMVSFVEDCDSGSQCNAWDSRYTLDPRQATNDMSPTHGTRPSIYRGDDTESQQNYSSQAANRYPGPHKKRSCNVQQAPQQQRCTNQQQQQHLPVRRILHSEDMFVAEHEANVDKDEESERVDESDMEVMSERPTTQHHDYKSKTMPGHEPWGKRAEPKSSSQYEASEYQIQRGGTLHTPAAAHTHESYSSQYEASEYQIQRGVTLQKPAAAHRNESYSLNLNPDIQQSAQTPAQDREWFASPQQASECGSIEGNKLCSSEGNTLGRFPYRLAESASHEQRLGDFSDWQGEHCSPNNESLHNQASHTSVAAHSQLAEVPRQCPPRMPRSTTPQTQAHLPVGNYPSNMSTKASYGKLKNYEPMHQTSGSSCEGSPAFSGDEKLRGDNTTSSHDESDVKEPKLQRPEVVCIDAMQLHADASRTITLSNLPLDLNEKELLSIFKKYGHVTKIYYIKDRNTGLFQGRAYGKFSKATEAFQAAQDLQKLTIDGHEICVQLYVNTA